MRFWLSLVLIVMTGLAAKAQQGAGPIGTPEGPWREQFHWVPMTDAAGVFHLLYARVCRPVGEAPAHVVVVAHGTPPLADTRPGMVPVACDSEAARWFLERGFVVVAAMRRGYGATGGPYDEAAGPCDNPDFARSGLESARDVAATVDYATALPFARHDGAAVVGQSAGGWAAIAYNTTAHPRVAALINMAGGRGGHHQNRPNENCRPDLLAAAAGVLARDASTPMLWVYTQNDSFFSPAIAASLYAAYSGAGGRAEFDPLPAFGSDGHRLFFGSGGSAIWGPLVARYLAARGLPGG
jgi:dienelactone hydrolase